MANIFLFIMILLLDWTHLSSSSELQDVAGSAVILGFDCTGSYKMVHYMNPIGNWFWLSGKETNKTHISPPYGLPTAQQWVTQAVKQKLLFLFRLKH